VVLFTTDSQDTRAVQDLRPRLGAVEVTLVSTTTLPALQTTLATVDAVVASRLHGVLLSHLAQRPVLALSYDWKVDRHMDDLGQSRYRMSIDDSVPQVWAEGFTRLMEERHSAVRTIAAGVGRARELVIAQFAKALP
jgi:polysaccharide pyruvyl transferase WcaK-like protein